MDATNFVLCGLGGQGILFMTKVLAEAAMNKGFNVMGAETHGMAQRGGSVISHLRLGDVQGSLVMSGSAHYLLSLNEEEGYRNLPFLSKKARLYVNADPARGLRPEVNDYLEKNGIICHVVPASTIAQESGFPMATNLVLLGFFSAFEEGPLTRDDLRATIEKISFDRFRKDNLLVFDAGHERGLEVQGH